MPTLTKTTSRPKLNGSAAPLKTGREGVRLLAQLKQMAAEQAGGNMEARVDAQSFSGTEREIAAVVNGMMADYFGVRRAMTAHLEAMAAGDFETELTTAR